MLDKEQIYTEYRYKVFNYINSRINHYQNAEDLCEDVFVKVLTNLDNFDETKSSLSTWIFNITKNTLYDFYRTNHISEELDPNLKVDEKVDDAICKEENLEALAKALQVLNDLERKIIILAYDDELNLKDIALKLKISYSYCKLIHKKALGKLKKELAFL